MKIVISFLTTNFSGLKNFWKKSGTRLKKSKFKGTDKIFDVDLGGKIAIIDWNNKKIIKEANILTPAGLDIKNNEIYVCTSGNKISVLDPNLKIKKTFSDKYLNDLHSLNLVNGKYILLASTGVDGLIMLDLYGESFWQWFATEHGYDTDPKGRVRVVNKNIDQRDERYPTLKQTTHLNSAIYVGKTKYFKNTIYCSLFHQGEIIAIDKKTLKSKVVLRGLRHPHAIYLIGKRIIISDTENRSVIISDRNLENIRREKISSVKWIQDTAIIKNGNLLISDPDNNRIIEWDIKDKKIKGEMYFNKEWRIYQAKPIK